eukprot:10437759-Alexandrium_andersonii.AAC.1
MCIIFIINIDCKRRQFLLQHFAAARAFKPLFSFCTFSEMAALPTSAELQAGRTCAGTPGASSAGRPSSSATPKTS